MEKGGKITANLANEVKSLSQVEPPDCAPPKCSCRAFSIDPASVAVAFTSLGLTVLNTVYKYFVTKTFVEVYLIDKNTHTMVQLIFLIWNMVNDPLFGFLQDFSRWQWMQSRRKVIMACAIPIAISYMLVWIPWYPIYAGCHANASVPNSSIDNQSVITHQGYTPCIEGGQQQWLIGLHLFVSMCLYDTFYSIMTSAQAGLFTEMTTEHAGRVRVVKYMELAKLPGSFALFALERASVGLSNFQNVQIFNGVAALMATFCFLYTGLRAPEAKREYRTRRPSIIAVTPSSTELLSGDSLLIAEVEEKSAAVVSRSTRIRKALRSTWQILKNRDFICVAIGQFLRVMRTIGFASFLMIFVPMLVSRDVIQQGSTTLGLYYLACDAAPKLAIVPLSMITKRVGPWPVVMGSIVLTMLNCLISFAIGRRSSAAVLIFLFLEGTLCRCVYPSAYNIFVPEITNADFVRHQRKKPYSALIYSLNQMAIKPPNSFVKILILYLIDHNGLFTAYQKNHGSLSAADESTLKDTMFAVACFFPMAVAVAEGIALFPYRMRFRHLREYCCGKLGALS